MKFLLSKKGIAIVILILVVLFGADQSGVFGDTRIGITLKNNSSLNEGLLAHYTFDGEFEQGTFEFGSGGATTTDWTSSGDYVTAIATDESGYIYFTGSCSNCGNQGGTAHHTYKIDPIDGSVIWATTTDPGSSNDEGASIAIDGSGFVYVTGDCRSCGNNGLDAHYTYKIDPSDGAMLWSTTTDLSSGNDIPYGVTTDSAGNIYVTGHCTSCGNNAGTAIYTYKLNSTSGELIWATTTDPSSSNDIGRAITTDPAGNVYITGSCRECGGTFLLTASHYTLKLSPIDGSVIWATTTDLSTSNEEGYALVYEDGNIYVAGTCNACGNQGNDAFYTYKVNADDGSMLWATTTDPESNTELPEALIHDGNNSFYVTGRCDGCGNQGNFSFYTFKVDEDDGSMIWATTTDPGTLGDEPEGLAITNDNNLIIAGTCTNCGTHGSIANHTLKVDPSDGSMIDTTSANAIRSVGADTVSGNIGQGVEFDGIDDYISIDDSPYDGTNGQSFSIGLWIKPETDSATSTVFHIGQETYSGGVVLQHGPDGLFGGRIETNESEYIIGEGGEAPYGEWTHVTITHDASGPDTTYLYENGVLLDSTTLSNADAGGSYSIALGKCSNDDAVSISCVSNQFTGLIDDFRMWDRTLSPSEVTRLYELGATTKINKTLNANPELQNGLTAHWSFDGDLSTVIEDRSGNGNDVYFPSVIGYEFCRSSWNNWPIDLL